MWCAEMDIVTVAAYDLMNHEWKAKLLYLSNDAPGYSIEHHPLVCCCSFICLLHLINAWMYVAGYVVGTFAATDADVFSPNKDVTLSLQGTLLSWIMILLQNVQDAHSTLWIVWYLAEASEQYLHIHEYSVFCNWLSFYMMSAYRIRVWAQSRCSLY